MPKIKWDKKDFIINLLMEKYGTPEINVMKNKYRHQLTAAMTANEIKAEIKALSNDSHENYSLDIKDLRAQLKDYVQKSLRRTTGTGKFLLLNYSFFLQNLLGRF